MTDATQSHTQRGRNDLIAWEQHKPDNFFTADYNLQRVVQMYMSETAYTAALDNMTSLGAEAATTIDAAAKVEDRIGNHPRLQRWTGLGERVEQIEFHPHHDRIGRIIWEHGVMALQASAGNTVHQMALFYLLNHNGESGMMCSLACTSGLIRALQQAADPALREQFLPPLLDKNYESKHHGAQFLTEVQGGSDVGANAVTATQTEDGSWRINGEKWFCSNINSDQFLMTARVVNKQREESETGTRGLGLFLVPRLLKDGSTNGFYIRRLKDKLGTRTLASAELDFQDCVAYNVGPVEQGFKNVVTLVLNTSRLMNAVACAGIMRRVLIEAGQYACHRTAFGNAIANFPMVQETIVDIMTESYAATASCFYLAHLLDKIETGNATPQDEASYRMLVNINKYITSIAGTETVHKGIEILGGNGAIESFSILPRLYRDMIVLESWEGTHNVLAVQVLRDCARYQIHEAFFADMSAQLATVTHDRLFAQHQSTAKALERTETMLARLLNADTTYSQAHARRFIDLAARVAQAVLMLVETQWELDRDLSTFKPQILMHFINKYLVPDYDPLDDPTYTDRLAHLMTAL